MLKGEKAKVSHSERAILLMLSVCYNNELNGMEPAFFGLAVKEERTLPLFYTAQTHTH